MALPRERLHRLLIGGLAVLLLWWAVASLWWPFGWDQGIFAWIGEVALHGGMPYRDAWDVKGPLTFYLFGFIDWLTGGGMWGIRLFDLVLLGAALGSLYRLVARWTDAIVASYAALLFGLAYARLGFWNTAQPDGWTALLTTIAFVPLFLTDSSTRSGAGYRAALVVGLCALFKPVYLPLAAIPGAWLLLAPGLTTPQRIRRVVGVGAAVLLPLVVTGVWFAARGAWSHLVDGYLLFNMESAAGDQARAGGLVRPTYWRFISQPMGLLLFPLAMAGAARLWRTHQREALLLAGWLLLALFAVAIQRRWYLYQVPPIYPPLALLATAGAAGLVGRVRSTLTRLPAAPHPGGILVATALVLLGYPLAKPVAATAVEWVRWQTGSVSSAEHYRGFAKPWEYYLHFRLDRALALAQYVAATTAPGDTVFVWNDPLVNYLAHRPTVSAYAFHVPLLGTPPTPRQEGYRRDFLARFRATPPAVVLMEARAVDPSYRENQANLVDAFPAFLAQLGAEYAVVDSVAGYLVLRPTRVASNIRPHRPIFPPASPAGGGEPPDRPR